MSGLSKVGIVRATALASLMVMSNHLPAYAETIEVKMLNRGQNGSMVFEPEFVSLKPGDTIQFRVGNKSHNAASIPGMSPEGYAGFKGKIDQEIAVTFDETGFYGIKCSPHMGMGMVMIVKVGDAAVTPDFIQADLPQRAKKRFQEILDRAGETLQ
ncbi:pseudoazurin [Brucella intermedia]|uniref:pseudoazurin n=1 Tax=Brucella intermedia TaxID=94625 RepID=UPI0022490379|nr:pseudoazurin [Brucella intermedia]